MPILGALIVNAFAQLVTLATLILGRKVAVLAAALTVTATIVAGVVTAVSAMVSPLLVSYPGAAAGVWLCVPDNAGACIAACLACDASVAVGAWWRRKVTLSAQVLA